MITVCDTMPIRESRQYDIGDASLGFHHQMGEPRLSSTPGPPSSTPPLRKSHARRVGGGEAPPTCRSGMSVVAFAEYPERLLCDPSNSLWLYAVFEYKYGYTEEMCRDQMLKLIQKMNRIAAYHFEASVKQFQKLPLCVQHFQILRSIPVGMATNHLVPTSPEEWAHQVMRAHSATQRKNSSARPPPSRRPVLANRESVGGGGNTMIFAVPSLDSGRVGGGGPRSHLFSSSTAAPSPPSAPQASSKHLGSLSEPHSRSFSSPSTIGSSTQPLPLQLASPEGGLASTQPSLSSTNVKRTSVSATMSPLKTESSAAGGGGEGGQSTPPYRSSGGSLMGGTVGSTKSKAPICFHRPPTRNPQEGEGGIRMAAGMASGWGAGQSPAAVGGRPGGPAGTGRTSGGGVVAPVSQGPPAHSRRTSREHHHTEATDIAAETPTEEPPHTKKHSRGLSRLSDGSEHRSAYTEEEEDVEEVIRQLQPQPLRVPEEAAVQCLASQWPSMVGLSELEEQLLLLREHAAGQQQAAAAVSSTAPPPSVPLHLAGQRPVTAPGGAGSIEGGTPRAGRKGSSSKQAVYSPALRVVACPGLDTGVVGGSLGTGARHQDIPPSPAKPVPTPTHRKGTASSIASSISPFHPPSLRPLARPRINVVMDIVASRKTLTSDPRSSGPYRLGQWVYKYYHGMTRATGMGERRGLLSGGSSVIQPDGPGEAVLLSPSPPLLSVAPLPPFSPMGSAVPAGKANGAVPRRAVTPPVGHGKTPTISRMEHKGEGGGGSGVGVTSSTANHPTAGSLLSDLGTTHLSSAVPSYSLTPSCSQLFVGISDSSIKMVGRDILYPYKVIPNSSHLANVSQRFSLLHTPSQLLMQTFGIAPLPSPHPALLPIASTTTTPAAAPSSAGVGGVSGGGNRLRGTSTLGNGPLPSSHLAGPSLDVSWGGGGNGTTTMMTPLGGAALAPSFSKSTNRRVPLTGNVGGLVSSTWTQPDDNNNTTSVGAGTIGSGSHATHTTATSTAATSPLLGIHSSNAAGSVPGPASSAAAAGTGSGTGWSFLLQPNGVLPICVRQPPLYLESIDQKRFIVCHPARHL